MTSVLLLVTALTLGLRHGIDWDHIAALVDICGASSVEKSRYRAMILAFCYAAGHGLIVFVLGLCAISFAAILPAWVDTVMERIVGATLLALGAYLLYAVYKVTSDKEFRLQSRFMLLSSLVQKIASKLRSHHPHRSLDHSSNFRGAVGGAFSIGLLHGLGAETGTQVLLVTAIGRTGTSDVSIAMLMAFIIGLIVSNSVIAWLATSGFRSTFQHKSWFMAVGVVAAAFSLMVGSVFVLGNSSSLPALMPEISKIPGAHSEADEDRSHSKSTAEVPYTRE